MNEIAVALAIEIEEKFRGVICYFGRAPHPAVKNPTQLIVLHFQKYNNLTVEVLTQTGQEAAKELATAVYEFLHGMNLKISDPFKAGPIRRIQFLNSDETPMFSSLPDYDGFAFNTQIQ